MMKLELIREDQEKRELRRMDARLRTSDRIVVTGGAGFIGANFVRYVLSQTRARVVVFDKLSYAGRLENLEEVRRHPRFSFVRGDIASRTDVETLFRVHCPTAVVNFAAETHVDRSIDGPRAFFETNAAGTFELLEAARRFGSELGPRHRDRFRFLHVSTDEVYGSLGEDGAFSEDTPYAPNSPYSATKAAADHLVRAYHRTYGLPTLTTNCSNNYGPYQFPEKLIPLMALNALEGRQLPIYGDGGNVRDWLFAEDHCEALLRVLEMGVVGEQYNVGGGAELSNLEVVNQLCSVLEELSPARENPFLERSDVRSYHALMKLVADRPGHDRRYAVDSSKIRRELGWTPRHDFGEGMRKTLRWYLENRDWCDSVGYERERLGMTAGGKA